MAKQTARLVKKPGQVAAVPAVPVVAVPVVSKGQTMLLKVAEWLAGYMSFRNPDDALVLALWSMGTWRFRYMFTYPYLVITKGQPGCGASQLQKLLALVCFNSWRAIGSPASWLPKLLDSADPSDPSIGLLTLFRDEAETFNTSRKDTASEILNSGYEQGQTIAKRVGQESIEFPAYCPKVFGMIGFSAETMIDRSVVLALFKGQPARMYRPDVAKTEGKLLASEIRDAWESVDPNDLEIVYPSHLDTRDQQIWSALFGMAQALRLDESIMTRLVRWSKDNCTWKNDTDNLKALVLKVDKDEKWAADAIADLRRVIRDGEKFILSAEAVSRMRELNDGPWRTVHGSGLDPLMLSKLLRRYSLEPKQFKIAKGKVARGYDRDQIASAKLLVVDTAKHEI